MFIFSYLKMRVKRKICYNYPILLIFEGNVEQGGGD